MSAGQRTPSPCCRKSTPTTSRAGNQPGRLCRGDHGGAGYGFDQIFIMVAGGDLVRVVTSGKREAADNCGRLAEAGYQEEKLKTPLEAIEPTRLAHRIDPQRMWMYTAKDDQVVPLAGLALQKAARLSATNITFNCGAIITRCFLLSR